MLFTSEAFHIIQCFPDLFLIVYLTQTETLILKFSFICK